MIKTTFDSYLEFSEKERKEIEKINHPKIRVLWHGEYMAEIDEFDNLSDAALYADIVGGIICEKGEF
jgi:hypothetical protein